MSETVLIAIITGISATLPNIIITIINNKNSFRIKKYENSTLVKREVILNFLDSIGKCVGDNVYTEDLSNFQIATNKLLLYFPNLDLDIINNVRESMFDSNSKNKLDVLLPLIKQLSISMQDK